MSRFSGGVPERPEAEAWKDEVMGKLEGKVAVITGGSSGMALASAQRFVEEGAYVFITEPGDRRRWTRLSKLIGRNVTGVRGDVRPISTRPPRPSVRDTVKREKGQDRHPVREALARAKPSHWARLPSSTSM